ncbi:FxsC protein [Streptomyces sp. NPDC007901]|uniref:FxsC protein n=1 Tax=Streptomyces sp. NPDC007901 TaxID=3364785 RepID=UPI0036E32CA9
MLRRLREILARSGVDLDGEELLDVLWLASNLPGEVAPLARRPAPAASLRQGAEQGGLQGPAQPGLDLAPDAAPRRLFPLHAAPQGKDSSRAQGASHRAYAVRAPGPQMLHSRHLTLGKALRPLRQRIPDRRHEELDVAGTVDAMAETGLPEIVTRPARSRWLSLTLLIDDGVSMVLWKSLASEIRTLMERAGAFRDVRVLGLSTRGAHAPLLSNRPFRQQGPYLPPAALRNPAGSTLVLVVSDGVGDAWWDGRMSEAAALWARRQPTAILQALPARLWANSGITTRPWHVTSVRKGGPTTAWRVTDPTLPTDLVSFDSIPIPVLEPTPASVGAWAQLVASPSATTVLPLWDIGRSITQPQHRTEPRHGPTAEAVLRFRSAASPEAYRLAAHLAAVAPITPPVMRMVQEALGPPTDIGHLVEVFLGGLMHNAATDTSDRLPQMEFFDFSDDARRILLGTLPARELLRTTRLTADRLAASVRQSPSFTAWATHPTGAAEVGAPERSFAQLEGRLLKRLGVAPPIDSPPADQPPRAPKPPEPREQARTQPSGAQQTDSTQAVPRQPPRTTPRKSAKRGAVREPYFFLSYARKDHPGELVKRFYDDLVLELRRTGADPAAQTPFRDVERLGLGDDWARELGDAVGHCRAFVALYSPAYLNSEYCGKEWTAFQNRLREYRRETEIDVPALVPVLWAPMEGELPEEIARFQYHEAGMGQDYVNHGLMHILRTDPTSQAYRAIVERVAARVRIAADRFRLPFTPGLDLGDVRGQFPVPGHRRAAAPGAAHVRVFVAAGTTNALPEGRNRLEYYGRSPLEWTPYYPPKHPTIALRAQRVIAEAGYTSSFEIVDEHLSSRLDETMTNNQTSILLVDPWAVRTPAYRNALADFDAHNRPATVVLVPYDGRDEESGGEEIWQDLSRVFWRNWRRQNDPNDPVFRIRVTRDEFDDRLAVMLTAAQNRLMEMESTTPFRLPAGPLLPPMSGLGIPASAGTPEPAKAPRPPVTEPEEPHH